MNTEEVQTHSGSPNLLPVSESRAVTEVKSSASSHPAVYCTRQDVDSNIVGDSGPGDESSPRALRKQPPRKSPMAVECPVCGLTLRPHELQQHYEIEVERLGRISKSGSRRSGESPRSRRHNAVQTLRRVRANRGSRRRRMRDAANGCDGEESTQCPVCQETIEGSSDVVADHVDACLRNSEEGGGSGSFEEYEWAGQSRVRASSMLEGGFQAAGIACRSHEDEDDDIELDVDGDDVDTYGGPQYSEADVVPLPADTEDNAQHSLAEDSSGQPAVTQSTEASGSQQRIAPSGPLVEEALRKRMQQLDCPHVRCLVCLEPYREPAVSVCCWHVYCKDCWLHTLGAKKLCPQCNSITSPADLRRIYL